VEGDYTLQLRGAYDSKFRVGATDVVFTVTGDTAEAGKTVRLEIPNPDERAWAPKLYAQLVQAMGAEVEPFKSPTEELNKVALNGHSRIQARVYTETFTKNDGTPGFRDKINTKSIRAAA
jgi:hypothetical protein